MGDLAGDSSETTLAATFGAPNQPATRIGVECRRSAGSGAGGHGPDPRIVYIEVIALRSAA